MRNFENWDKYLDILEQDVYNQPSDSGHVSMLSQAMNEWSLYLGNIKSVLDVGCGEDLIASEHFSKLEIDYTGVDLNPTASSSTKRMDMSFLDFNENSFDAILARHVLEHSPAVLITLMEWHRVSRNYLFLVLPNPGHYGYIGRNHYSVMPKTQARWMLRRAGWKIIKNTTTPEEFRFVCEKKPLISSEGWAEEPLTHNVYTADRDDKDFIT